jgi:hypothetical protein
LLIDAIGLRNSWPSMAVVPNHLLAQACGNETIQSDPTSRKRHARG